MEFDCPYDPDYWTKFDEFLKEENLTYPGRFEPGRQLTFDDIDAILAEEADND